MRLLWGFVLTAGLLLAETRLARQKRASDSDARKRLLEIFLEYIEISISNLEGNTSDSNNDDPMLDEAKAYLRGFDLKNIEINQRTTLAQFNYITDVTPENAKIQQDLSVVSSTFYLDEKFKASKYYRHSDGWPYDIKRQLKMISEAVVTSDPFLTREMAELSSNLSEIHASAVVCEKLGGKCYNLEPDLINIMATSRDYDKLLWAWKGWNDAAGPKMKPLYTQLVNDMNKEATENGYADTATVWMEDNDETNSKGFEALCEKLLSEVMPLYRELHAYVRGRLGVQYGSDKVDPNKPIPVHLLGNMWAQDWSNINPVVSPYANKLFQEAAKTMQSDPTVDFTTLVETAENFYTSIGLFPMTKAFWDDSMFTKPTNGRVVECHAAAHDMWTGNDYRVTLCGELTMDSFYAIHHEMGHIEYFMSYSKQPSMFREGAHSAFHEAVGDTIGLSSVTPKHLATIGLVSAEQDTDENSISFLLNLALQKVAFLPFGYLVDKWRWSVFRGDIKPDDYTTAWWSMYHQYMGLAPAVPRDDPRLFDPGAKYHIPAGVPYIRYFICHIVQFQFLEALCTAAGHVGPLSKCDIYKSKAAGMKFLKMLRMGSSRPWPDALEQLTGARMFDTGPIRRYFEPLRLWLVDQNRKNNYTIGWSAPSKIVNPNSGISLEEENAAARPYSSASMMVIVFLGMTLLRI